jgi:spermidine synthase
MMAWELIGDAKVPGNEGTLCLYRRGREFSIRTNGRELMNSSRHGSEEALSEFVCARIACRGRTRTLIGGLGMGFTLSAALRRLGSESRVDVVELVPEVVEWNRGILSHLAGNPIADGRVTLLQTDVARILEEGKGIYDAILLDVDNGPDHLVSKDNAWLYSLEGLAAASSSLRPTGLLGVWSAGPDTGFPKRLRRAGFSVEEIEVPARACGKGGRHTVWIAAKGSSRPPKRRSSST